MPHALTISSITDFCLELWKNNKRQGTPADYARDAIKIISAIAEEVDRISAEKRAATYFANPAGK